MKKIVTTVMAFLLTMSAQAQRTVDKLDRGLVAVKTSGGVFCSWRINGEEYYDVAYNLYRDGVKLNTEPLTVSNYTDVSGTVSSKYTVKAVVRGQEQTTASAAVTPLTNNYKEIKIAEVPSNIDGRNISGDYEPNDAIVADVDGDGEMEILLKLRNTKDAANSYPVEGKDFDIIQIYKQNGKLLWWIDCGPNMVDFQSNEINIAAYDWDQDGKAECVLRGADGMVIHMADGTTKTIGDASVNTRGDLVRSSAMTFTHTGAEYLLYLNGETGKPYSFSEYPLKRLESGETNLKKAWGDEYGHRSSKNFFGAPYLDGRKPSIFLARGIYTRHKMIAYDVDPATHELKERWRWVNNTPGSPWYGQGYHNYTIADVDWDGRDEIVFGSMVIDDNGHGLSTTGLGHGDAHHVGDFNPYVHGQEIAACNEDLPSNNYRDATTSKIYYRLAGGSDDGRSMAGNFTDDVIGGQFYSGHESSLIGCVSNKSTGLPTNNVTQNFRIYWDGDLLDETFNGMEVRNSAGVIYKYGKGKIETFTGVLTNNDTKATPCFQGDIFGDWREEVIMRSADNKSIRIYTTTIPTEHRNYTLLHDPQYRNAMITQMNGYNPTPHVSYFLGEKEGITMAPPAPNMTDKTEVANGGSITSATNDKQVILAETGDATVNVADGASPYIFFDNAPTWVQGHDDNDNITTTTYKHTLTGGAFAGEMRLVKLGDGELTLPTVEQKYTGNTEVWAGTVNFNGTMTGSHVWLNRFAVLNSEGGKFPKGIEADYGATIRPGGASKVGKIETNELKLNFGSIVEFDIDANGNADQLVADAMKIEKKDWTDGPEYLAPRFNFILPESLVAGTYQLAKVGKIDGDLKDIVLTGMKGHKASLKYENGTISLVVEDMRAATSVVWTAEEDNTWQLAEKSNFKKQADNAADVFVSGDHVIFNDEAKNTTVQLTDDVAPATVEFDNSNAEYTLTGSHSLIDNVDIVKNGDGNVNITNENTFKGSVTVNKGSLTVNTLGQVDGVNTGALGLYTNKVTLNGGTLIPAKTMTTAHPVALGSNGGTINTPSNVTMTMTGSISGTGNVLTKEGDGTLVLAPSASYSKLIVNGGTVKSSEPGSTRHAYPTTIVLNDATLRDADGIGTESSSSHTANVEVPEGKSYWYLDSRCNYSGTLKGAGTLNVGVTSVRSYMKGNWSQFTGTVNFNASKTGQYTPHLVWDNTYGLKNATVGVYCEVSNNDKSVTLGNLVGNGQLFGKGTWTIGSLNEDVKYTGKIDGGKIVKTGDGLWTMSSLPTNLSGASSVNGGVLNLSNSAKKEQFFGSYSTTVSGTGTLAGQALLYGITVNAGGTLKPGNYTSSIPTGSLKTTSGVFCNEGSKAKFFLYNNKNGATSRSYLEVGGTFQLNGDLVVEAYSKYAPKAGDSFTLWTANNFMGTPSSVTLPKLPSNLAWDTSDLYKTTGVLKVVAATGISQLGVNDEFTGSVYTVGGVKVGELTTTKATALKDLKTMGVASGIYFIRVAGETLKYTVK